MRINRIFVDAPLAPAASLELPPEQTHHLARVLRARVGQKVNLFNGTGGYFVAEITAIQKRSLSVQLLEHVPDPAAGSKSIHLAQCISRGSHMDYTIQKATELGVAGITPLFSENGNVRLSGQALEKKRMHWRQVMISACEQCGRNRLPDLAAPVAFADWIVSGGPGTRLLLHPAATMSLAALKPDPASVTIISGPEGGLSEAETDLAQQQGCVAVNLGPRVLRTETAALAAVSIAQALWGDMG